MNEDSNLAPRRRRQSLQLAIHGCRGVCCPGLGIVTRGFEQLGEFSDALVVIALQFGEGLAPPSAETSRAESSDRAVQAGKCHDQARRLQERHLVDSPSVEMNECCLPGKN